MDSSGRFRSVEYYFANTQTASVDMYLPGIAVAVLLAADSHTDSLRHVIVAATVVVEDDLPVLGSCCIAAAAAAVDMEAAVHADHGIGDSVFAESMSSEGSEVVAVRVEVMSVGIAAVRVVVMTLSGRCGHCCCSCELIPFISRWRMEMFVLIRDPMLVPETKVNERLFRRCWLFQLLVNKQQ